MPTAAFKSLWETVNKGDTWTGFVKNKTRSGGFYWVFATVYAFINSKGERDISLVEGNHQKKRAKNMIFCINSRKKQNKSYTLTLLSIAFASESISTFSKLTPVGTPCAILLKFMA